jgi:UDP-2-acetamido-2,6-beta-L-arabino-hexul-4-ose reductase
VFFKPGSYQFTQNFSQALEKLSFINQINLKHSHHFPTYFCLFTFVFFLMIKVGITGQSGFIGTHLFNYLSLKKDELTLIPFKDGFFQNQEQLNSFVNQCDTIVHLAAVNRHDDPNVIYHNNIKLVNQLIEACETTGSKPHILFSSSTQEEKNNPYGNSKREGRQLLVAWAERTEAHFTGLVIPNVFGPFGYPYYNSVIATFCHQLTHGENPQIDVDGVLKLIYVSELVQVIYDLIFPRTSDTPPSVRAIGPYLAPQTVYHVPHTSENKVSEILALLQDYKENYFEKGIFPGLDDKYKLNLFKTFMCYIDHEKFFPFHLKLNSDDRGTFVEMFKLKSGGQISFSTTKAGVTRGNHFHTRKLERFVVIKGMARIELRRIGTDEVIYLELKGEKPAFVDIPIWYTHNITNTGNEDLYTLFWTNEFHNPGDPDTYFEKV